MRELIRYYYNITIYNIQLLEETVYLLKDKYKIYIFKKIFKSKELLEKIDNSCNLYNYERNYILRNIFGELVTQYNEGNYVLIQLKKIKNMVLKKLQFVPVISSSFIPEIWENKILIVEKKLFEYKKIHSLAGPIAFYYIGLAENAISLMKKYKEQKEQTLYIQRERVYYPNYALHYFDQSNMIIDYKSRDLAEFYKSKILKKKISIKEVYEKLLYYNFNELELIYFLCRIIYPSYFFDNLEKVNKENIANLNFIINKRAEIEEFIRQVVNLFRNHFFFVNLEWIKKVDYKSTFITPLHSGTSSFIAS